VHEYIGQPSSHAPVLRTNACLTGCHRLPTIYRAFVPFKNQPSWHWIGPACPFMFFVGIWRYFINTCAKCNDRPYFQTFSEWHFHVMTVLTTTRKCLFTNVTIEVIYPSDVRNTFTHISLNFDIYMKCLRILWCIKVMHEPIFFVVRRNYVTNITVWQFVFTTSQLQACFFCFLIWNRFSLQVMYILCFFINNPHDNICNCKFLDNPRTMALLEICVILFTTVYCKML
jgi:hypothetical protein